MVQFLPYACSIIRINNTPLLFLLFCTFFVVSVRDKIHDDSFHCSVVNILNNFRYDTRQDHSYAQKPPV